MVGALVATSIGIIVAVVAVGWRTGTLRETRLERFDHEFRRIIRRLSRAD